MKTTRVPDNVRKLASFAIKIPGFKFLFQGMYRSYLRKVQDNRNEIFQKNALQVLREFDDALTSNNLRYSVFAGTLLGAVREKGFLKHDLDIDCAMFYSDYSQKVDEALFAKGFKKFHSFLVDDGKSGMEETYIKDGVSIDIFYIYSDDEYPTYQCDFHSLSEVDSKRFPHEKAVRRIQFPVSTDVLRMPFETIEVNVIANYNEWLCHRYGNTYMTPDPNFHDKGDNPGIKEWTSVRAKYIKY